MNAALQAEVEALGRAANIAENRRKLKSCSQHFFDCMELDWRKKTRPDTLRCVMCGGILSFEAAEQYATAIAHMGGDPNAVIEGFAR